jgi:hypothetical protein|tara:strand:+ start:2208 stop:2636 length:429 start_codon:yes stop_codon:yes gene_type:complete
VTYTVGQIVYLLSRKDVKVFPALVIEEIKRKTIESEIISYVVRLPDKSMSEVLLEEISADVYVSLEDLKESMMKNAKVQIERLLEKAEKTSDVFASEETDNDNSELIINENGTGNGVESGSVAVVDLGNGQTGKINLKELQA